MKSTNDIVRYEASVRLLAEKKIGDILWNEGDEHAKIVFFNLFSIAERTVRIFAENFCSDVPNSEEYITSLRAFLEKNGKVDLLLEREPSTMNLPVFDTLREYIKQVNIKTTTLRPRLGDVEINFCAVDDFAYRIETDKEKRKAHVSFNDTRQTSELRRAFDLMIENEKSATLNIQL